MVRDQEQDFEIADTLAPMRIELYREDIECFGLTIPSVRAQRPRPTFVGELTPGKVIFAGAALVLVRVGDRNITVHVADTGAARGDEVRVGLTPQDEPRAIEVRGRRIDL